MKIISLNTFGGTFFEPLMGFITGHAESTDVFCFQEVLDAEEGLTVSRGARANLFEEMSKVLPDFQGYYLPVQDHFVPAGFTDDAVCFGMAIFIRKGYGELVGDFFLNGHRDSLDPNDKLTMPTAAQYAQFVLNGTPTTVCNVHGIAWPGDKLDSPIRFEQTKRILDFAQEQPGEKIICGDFNLLPDTKSITQFEERGFSNLIKEFAISSTRGSLFRKLHPEYADMPGGFQEFADYTFVSSGIEVKKFEVPDVPVSDHLPMVVVSNAYFCH